MYLERKKTTNFFGVIIDENLNWNDHIRHITTCISRNVGVLYKMKKFISFNTLVMLYNSFILPYVTYCNLVWAISAKTKVHLLITIESPSYMYWVTIFISHRSNILQTENPNSRHIRYTFVTKFNAHV